MKKITQESLIKDAKSTLFATLVLTAIIVYLIMDAVFSRDDMVVGLTIIALVWISDGYRSIRLLIDKTYLKQYWIRRTDERNVQIEDIVLRRMFQIIFVLYFTGAGLVLGYFSQDLSSEVQGILAAAFAGLTALLALIFYSLKWYYQRKL